MHTDNLRPFSIVHYDYVFDNLASVKYQIKWSCKDIFFHTCGDQTRIRALQYDPKTVKVSLYQGENLLPLETISLEQFMHRFPSEEFDLNFNCHGWTFTNGHFLLMDQFIPDILASEYMPVSKADDHDIVVFKCLEHGDWVHSAKRDGTGYSHKDWIKSFYHVDRAEDIQLMPQYANTSLHYFKRKKRDCNLVCFIENEGRRRAIAS